MEFNGLPLEEQQRLKERYRRYRNLGPAGQDRVKKRLDRINALPVDNRVEAEKKYDRNREMPAHERMHHLKQSKFWENLSEEEKEIFKKLLFTDN